MNEGQQKLTPSRQASKLLSTGELVFGGTNGFKIFHPDSLKDINNASRIMFTNFEIFNQPVQIGAENSPLNKHINYVDTITLPHNNSVFSISYTGINFIDPSMIKYRYRLLGFIDDSWQNVGIERKVTYTNLQPGKYVFEVEGEINAEKISSRILHIIIQPPWWATTWFRLLALSSLLLLLYGIYWYRLKRIRQQNKILAIKVNERTNRLQSANAELRQKNYFIQEQKEEIQAQAEELEEYTKEIHLINERLEDAVVKRTARLKKSNEELDNFVYRVSHDIRAPLSSILGLIALIKMETLPTKLEDYINMVSQSIHKLDTFVKNILDYSRNARLKVQPEEINFSHLLSGIEEELKYMQNTGNLELIREFNIEENFYNDPLRLQVIFRNLISNAIKYQNPYEEHSYAKIKISVNAQELNLQIEDNGIGIRKEDQQKIFDMFFRSDNKTAGSGLGLYIVKEAIEKLGGEILLDSQVHKGTTFIIKLPNLINACKTC
ncbi:ATP-binding protein [Chondrinema litorale]|uniref:ATP-binding protein n=1 Tax=Chondrinema litorale TaxID=2994555 RepID=UPI0025430896|nr:ATP-binding protein [Chondrinema litorale]UZR96423.1 ATP-binding protein [Chondrinema litorale]